MVHVTTTMLLKGLGYGALAYCLFMILWLLVYRTVDKNIRYFFRRKKVRELMDFIDFTYPEEQAKKDPLIREEREKAIIIAKLSQFEVEVYQKNKLAYNRKLDNKKQKEIEKQKKEALKNGIAKDITEKTTSKRSFWSRIKETFSRSKDKRGGETKENDSSRDRATQQQRVLPIQAVKRIGANKPSFRRTERQFKRIE